MSYVENRVGEQQIALCDSYNALTDRERKLLGKSWATTFANEIFPNIDESPYAVLYSDVASRPNTPVNVIIGALLLKELMGLSDDGIMEALMFDVRYQVALHTTSYKEQPISDRTLGRFRARCIKHEELTGEDLLHGTITALAEGIAKTMQVDRSLKRMDSLMVESNIKKMSRLELLYTCVSNLVNMVAKDHEVPEQLKHYLSKDDLNTVIYHNKSDDTQSKIETVLSDAKTLLGFCGSCYNDAKEYQLLTRVLGEQTVMNEDGTYRLREKGEGMDSNCLQNPADPDASYRDKAGKQHSGYCANVIEETGENGSVVTDYQYEKNNHSDSDFAKEAIESIGKQDETVTLVADGAYSGTENETLAKDNNIELITTNLTGKDAPDIHADFKFTEDGTRVTECPNGQAPKSCRYDTKSGQCTVSFHKCQCENCPYAEQCKRKINKRTVRLTISVKSKNRAIQQRSRKSEEFKAASRFRNGVETIPSMLRRLFDVDEMPVRGLIRSRFSFSCKIGALNFLKYRRYKLRVSKCALIPANT